MQYGATYNPASQAGEKVELYFSAKNISNKDGLFGKSDPQIKLYRSDGKSNTKKGQIG